MCVCHLLPPKAATVLVFFFFVGVGAPGHPQTAQGVTPSCSGNYFQDSYYLFAPADFDKASRFYLSLPEQESSADHELKSLTGERLRTEIYYDDETASLLKSGVELSSSVIENLAGYDPERESIVFVDRTLDPVERIRFQVRRYSRRTTELDKHPLFGKVKRGDRESLTGKLGSWLNTESVNAIRPSLEIEHRELNQLYRYFGIGYGAITLAEVNINVYGLDKYLVVLKFELFRDKIEALTELELQTLSGVLCDHEQAFRKTYPGLKPLPWLGYATYSRLADDALPHRNLFQRRPLIYKLGQVLVLAGFGFLVLYLLIGRYSRHVSYRISIRPGKN